MPPTTKSWIKTSGASTVRHHEVGWSSVRAGTQQLVRLHAHQFASISARGITESIASGARDIQDCPHGPAVERTTTVRVATFFGIMTFSYFHFQSFKAGGHFQTSLHRNR
jgi:hypothetical protein